MQLRDTCEHDASDTERQTGNNLRAQPDERYTIVSLTSTTKSFLAVSTLTMLLQKFLPEIQAVRMVAFSFPKLSNPLYQNELAMLRL